MTLSSPGVDSFVVRELTSADLPAWRQLFERSFVSCYCRYWHFAGDKNAWLARGALCPEDNAAEAESALGSSDGTARGLIVVREDRAASSAEGRASRVVGWLKLVRRDLVPKLRRLPVYRHRDLGADDETLSIACVLVDPAERGQGVAARLVAGAVEVARASGLRRLEAYPRHAAARLHDEEAWMGPERVFQMHGFVAEPGEVDSSSSTFASYPVYVRTF